MHIYNLPEISIVILTAAKLALGRHSLLSSITVLIIHPTLQAKGDLQLLRPC